MDPLKEPRAPSILIVDDDPRIRKLCGRILEQKDYLIAEATTGEEALALVKETTFDLVILDLRMPDMDGFEFLKIARKKLPDIKIVVMSGFLQGTMLKAAKLFGAAATIEKPFDPESFLAVVSEALKQ